jgi:adenosylmethionine---8-amino-7-oxononanoate aminotransferase
MGHRVTLEARRRGAIIRPLGDVVVLMPPLAISEEDLARLVEITADAIEPAALAAALRAAA